MPDTIVSMNEYIIRIEQTRQSVACVCRMTVCSMSLLDESRLMSKPPKFAWRVFFRNRCQVGRQRCSRQILKLTPYHYTIQLDFYDFPIHPESLDINYKLLSRVLGILIL